MKVVQADGSEIGKNECGSYRGMFEEILATHSYRKKEKKGKKKEPRTAGWERGWEEGRGREGRKEGRKERRKEGRKEGDRAHIKPTRVESFKNHSL
jgi:hypothetical protein